MIGVWGRRADNLEESGDKPKAVPDKVESQWCLNPVWVNFGNP